MRVYRDPWQLWYGRLRPTCCAFCGWQGRPCALPGQSTLFEYSRVHKTTDGWESFYLCGGAYCQRACDRGEPLRYRDGQGRDVDPATLWINIIQNTSCKTFATLNSLDAIHRVVVTGKVVV